jgi:hypothetical protein
VDERKFDAGNIYNNAVQLFINYGIKTDEDDRDVRVGCAIGAICTIQARRCGLVWYNEMLCYSML